MSPTRSRPLENFLAEHASRTEGELRPPDVEFLQNLTIVPSESGETSGFQPLSRGMEAIYELLVAEKSSLEGPIHKSDDLQEWVTKYLETYSNNFHLRWPILHAPTLEMEIKFVSLPLAASVCVIGAWCQNNATWTERFYALRVHEILLQRLLLSLVRTIYSSWRNSPLISID